MKEMKRFLSLVLCLVMLVGMMPVSAAAEESEGTQPTVETVAVESSETTEAAVTEETEEESSEPEASEEETSEPEASEEESSEPEETEEETEPEETEEEAEQEDDGVLQILMGSEYAGDMSAVMAQIQAAYSDIDEMYFLGNYSDAEALLAEAQGYYALDADVTLVQGAEDEMSDLLTWSGFHDTNDYAAFVINEEEYVNGVADILSILDAYLYDRVASGFDQPIFVLSNRGLHYGSGNTDARDVFEKLNAAAAEGLTIIYVYGEAEDTYLGEGAVCLQVGDTISVAEAETYAEETLNFTYLNAGAVSENMTVFTIGEETVSVSRYDAQGLCQMKNEGIGDELMAANTAVYESPLSVKITAPAEAVVDAPYGDFEAEADTDAIYILAGGDFQAGDNGKEDHYYSRINMGNILDQIKEHYSRMDGFIFVGDYDGDSHNDSNANAGVAAMMEEVSERFNTLNHDNSYLIEGNHETGAVSGIDATRGYDCDGYAVYLINETDFCERQEGKSTQIQNVANNLKTWLFNKIGEGYDAPIFVVTHTPLGYTTRTYTNGDSLYGKYVFDVLNDAGKNGLNIIFLHGHDHAWGADNYLGGEAIYLPVGDKINICVPGDKTKWTEETLNFTYMNAGYVGYYNENYYNVNSYEENKLTMTVFKIADGQVTVERYNKDDLYNLKSAGREGFYSNASTCAAIGLSYNTDVYASPQTITLQTSDVADMGTIGGGVAIPEEEPEDDVTTSGGGSDNSAEIIAPVPGTPAVPGTSESTKYVYTLDTDGTVTDKANAEQGYLIVGSGNASAMTDSLGATGVTITNNAITLDAQPNYEWWITSDGKITDGTNYLRFTGSTSWGSPSGSVSVVTNASQATSWEISHSNNGQYTVSVDYSYSSWGSTRTATYYLRYNSNAFSVTSSSNTVRLFSGTKVTTPATEGTPAVPGTNGTYGWIEGKLTYNVARGTTAESAMAVVQAGIDGYYCERMEKPGAGAAGTKVEDSVLTWEWVDTFDGNTAGDYAIAIKYGNHLLGTAEVVVPASSTYYKAEGNGLYLVDMKTTEANALAAVKAGVTVYSATNAEFSDKNEISDDDVTWTWVDKYNGADSGPYTVEILYNGTSLGTVEVKVNIQYETGIEEGWTDIGETEATGGTYYQRVENVNNLVSGEEYLIIFDCSNQTDSDAFVIPTIVTHGSGNSQRKGPDVVASNGITDNATITGDYDDYLWTLTRSGTGWKIGNGSQYINVAMNNTTSRGELSFTTNGEALTIASGSNNPADANSYSFAIRDSSSLYWQYNTTATLVYATDGDDYTSRFVFYGREEGTSTPGGRIYAKIEGPTSYTVTQGTSAYNALAKVKAGINGYTATDDNGTGKTELADSDLTWKWKNTYAGMVTGTYWVEISYQGKVLGTVEVHVEPGAVNNYPEYPDEGAVKVNKTGTGIDFQSSGIAQVEVSASGIPMKKGVDVIIMVDTSSSMKSWCICNKQGCTETGTGHQRRNVVFEAALEDLIAQLQSNGEDGKPMDIRVALADFNGFNGYNSSSGYGSPYDREQDDTTNDTDEYSAANQAMVYTGDHTLTQGAFVAATDLPTDSADFNFQYVSGTNYDYAFDAIYQLGKNIKDTNAEMGEQRDLYVVFMSDGAPMQYNYYHSQGNSTRWQYWLTGTVENNGGFENIVRCQEHTYYYDEATGNQHRMANAVKGNPLSKFEIIRKATTGLEDVLTATDEENMYMIPGLGATVFSIAFDPVADGNTPASAMTHVLEDIASEQTETTQYYYMADTADDLSNAFTSIGSAIAYAAYNARFVDQMGDDYNLQMSVSNYSVVDGTTTIGKTITPKIEILSYDIYTKAEADAGQIPEGKNVGDRKGTYTILETVTFNADGTAAYSDKKSGNILIDGVICANTFWYNTNATAVAVAGVSIPTDTKADGTTTGSINLLPSETFYWKMGTVQSSELAMRYYVYLEGSMEGTREGGSYPTNEYATLYYDNYLHNPCKKDTVSPVLAWKEANVSYAFYLVDENGNIIVNQTTGQTGTFANKIAVTNPVVYETILLNNLDQVSSIEVASAGEGILPAGYELYDRDSVYTITINSNTTGQWEIAKGTDKVASTYVTQYKTDNASAYSNALTNDTVGDDYTHTVVWFAVLWKVQALPDAVVVDYGLPVDISVLANDMFGEKGKLAGVGAYSDKLNLTGHDEALASGFGATYTGTYGSAKADASAGTVRYTLKDMQMNGYEKFAYAVNYTGDENKGYYYDTVTVIPATTIYYEDSFLTYTATNTQWVDEGTKIDGAVQDEDRPGQYSLTDANNIYGFDHVNEGMSTFSLGTAKKVTVDADSYAKAEFTFNGTGFDVISMTSNMTGILTVQVYDTKNTADTADDKLEYAKTVDTYYGYKQVAGDGNGDGTVAEGEMTWVVDPDASGSIYQVPVIEFENLPYGQYRVVIRASYSTYYDNVEGSDSYDLYLDAIRIYDPANDGASDGSEDTTIENAYLADGEGWPSYIELRNKIIAANSFDNVANEALTDGMEGLVFIDGDASVGDAQLSDYISYGPNNEVYLAPGQRVAFILGDDANNVENVHIGIKSADGNTGTYTITNIAGAPIAGTDVEAGDYYAAKTDTINTTTDMYYDITGYKGDIIVISNTGDRYKTTGIISLTNIKFTHKSDPNAVATANVMALNLEEEETASNEGYVYMTPAAAALTLRSLNRAEPVESTPGDNIPEETVPEETIPETTVPEETVPETTVPETTVPEETIPETTVPEETEPEETTPENPAEQIMEIVQNVVNTVVNALKNLFGGWFR